MDGCYMKGKVVCPGSERSNLVARAGYCAPIGRTLVGVSELRLWYYLLSHDSPIVRSEIPTIYYLLEWTQTANRQPSLAFRYSCLVARRAVLVS